MRTSTLNKILGILIIAALGWSAYIFQDNIPSLLKIFGARNPCNTPIAYSIGEVDPRFGISKQEFKNDIEEAAKIWGQALNKKVFVYSNTGSLKINLVYDNRQNTTQQLNKLDSAIDSDKASYDNLKLEYDQLMIDYNKKNSEFKSRLNAYNSAKAAYEQQVAYWQNRGGAPQKEYNALEQQKDILNNEANALNQLNDQLKSQADSINDVANRLNQLAAKLNLNVGRYNGIGAEQGEEFEQGVYKTSGLSESIDIYQYDNKTKLIRVLAHELGHALGIEHLNNPLAIMYLVNQGSSLILTEDDINALKNVCQIKD